MTDYDSKEWGEAVDKYVEILILTGRVRIGEGVDGLKGARELAERELRRLTMALSDKPASMRTLAASNPTEGGGREHPKSISPLTRKAPTWPGKGEPGY